MLYSIGGETFETQSENFGKLQRLTGDIHFNVTKSVDFSQCRNVPDVLFGFPTATFNMAQIGQKEMPPNGLSRSTTMRFVLLKRKRTKNSIDEKNEKDDYTDVAIKRTELFSHYSLKSLQAETSEQGSSTMNAIVSAELNFRSVKPIKISSNMPYHSEAYTNDANLIFSTQWDNDVKRFYAYGEQELPGGNKSPFSDFHGRVIRTEQALRKLIQLMQTSGQQHSDVRFKFQLNI